MNKECIEINCSMSDPKGIFIPKGTSSKLNIKIVDESAVFSFDNHAITKKFAYFEIKEDEKQGIKRTLYLERVGKSITMYPGKNKEEIKEIILEQLKKLGANIK